MGIRNRDIFCCKCSRLLEKDHIALSKKLLGRQIEQFMCINCLSDYLDIPVDVLLVKIEEFKEQGCGLFK